MRIKQRHLGYYSELMFLEVRKCFGLLRLSCTEIMTSNNDVIHGPPVIPGCQQINLLVPELPFCCTSSRLAHYAGGILKRRFYYENRIKSFFLSILRKEFGFVFLSLSNVFSPQDAGGI